MNRNDDTKKPATVSVENSPSSGSVDRLTDILRAEANGNDLTEDNGRIVVLAEKLDGTLYEVGSACCGLLLEKHAKPKQIIDRIKFTPNNQHEAFRN